MNNETKSAVLRLMDLALELNAPDFHVFVDYSGHVPSVWLRIHVGGWKRRDEKHGELPTHSEWGYLTDEHGGGKGSIERLIDILTTVHDDYRSPDWPECDDCLGGGK